MDILDVVYDFLPEDLAGHCSRVAKYTAILYQLCDGPTTLGYSKELVFQVASYHDLGKLWVPSSILNKPGRLTHIEWDVIYQHPNVGARIISEFAVAMLEAPADKEVYELATVVASQHHERWDGGGYIHNLNGDKINPIARMCSIADSFDAMTVDRPYRKALSMDVAFDEIHRQSGHQFDPEYADIFVENRHEIEAAWSMCNRLVGAHK